MWVIAFRALRELKVHVTLVVSFIFLHLATVSALSFVLFVCDFKLVTSKYKKDESAFQCLTDWMHPFQVFMLYAEC